MSQEGKGPVGDRGKSRAQGKGQEGQATFNKQMADRRERSIMERKDTEAEAGTDE